MRSQEEEGKPGVVRWLVLWKGEGPAPTSVGTSLLHCRGKPHIWLQHCCLAQEGQKNSPLSAFR